MNRRRLATDTLIFLLLVVTNSGQYNRRNASTLKSVVVALSELLARDRAIRPRARALDAKYLTRQQVPLRCSTL